VADHVCILEQGCLRLDAPLDSLRELYRRIDLVFAFPPPEREFQISGVERICTNGRQMSLFVSGNAEAVTERAHNLNASSVEVTRVGLREIFLETVREN
jgi:ABC-2 type transport system ATP-binding protein